jgi:hypothetical protein
MKRKYDWESLKTDFMLSKHLETSEWIREALGENKVGEGNTLKQTRNWSVEKRAMLESAKQMAIDEAKKKLVDYYRPSIKEL